MLNDLKYTVRSREIIDLVAAMRSARLTLSPYFQRNLVWRDAHKRDFIDTIMRGYPFPQIFLARGPIDLDTMEASQAVVDGQQRLNSIRDFVDGKLDFEGRAFRELTQKQREDFLKYEVAVIDFDLDAGDPRLKDVFYRLNRTYYSLSAIEKLASEYSASEFMLVARVLCGEIVGHPPDDDELGEVGSENDAEEPLAANIFSRDPGIDAATWEWLLSQAEGPYTSLVRSKNIFTSFEFDRKVPLMFTLNLMCTYMTGYFKRNDRVRKYLEERASNFPERDEVIAAINLASKYIGSLDIPEGSIWWNKANFFTLVSEFSRLPFIMNRPASETRSRLLEFSNNMPADYALAAREGVGQKAEREVRGKAIRGLLASQQITP
ncbi:DUF262 domain-containing protein [Bradyrhizobium iriomotense]|uniref:DUF262 domain-containing protein n=1 Tax=Bradyrhizobium iriomotense TaxID=441950 RepID=UPI001B8A38F5|nr:DUF262 domain-containing protein [Bradyrhizobium iriomotense]MBR0786928.1 DUF262 domain-containing protein [Bradyrhizobium iriomotense]